MSSLFEKLNGILLELSCSPYIQTIDCIWYKTDSDVYWNEDNNLEDLEEVEGETYGGEIKESPSIEGDCVFVNYDNGCGETITAVFKASNEVKFDGEL